ncbi:hypothetical protein [Paraburkholderia caballeronis]|uniref:hypothetical protein n=1 Tax=Paraburkholderia caballeronis TaxID=416943 RepID=UPI00106599C6|nr:hypothetical protein [Paraburkholderia caballeronis]TDV06054.1 hypothetical protein C7408_12435 [Paraburkholderia caballeronis]TDV09594.1 hypothetical protein C7406_12635 [Paraburkholderia caballeronis]TDV21659.1 hypothetical protein C7404_12135 [Paraburkholderia caballeronis]
MSRQTDYKPEYAELARNYCLLGATDEELAAFFGVTDRTIRSWKKRQPEFAEAIVEGSRHANVRVTGRLYDRCMAGDVTAIIWWQKNRMGWRDRTDVVAKVGISPVDELLSEVEGTTFKPKDAT